MSRLTKVLVLATVAAASFGAGAAAAIAGVWGQPLATVRVENRSGQPLRQLEVRFRSHYASGVVKLPALKDGEHAIAKIYIPGEGEYTVHATRADGTSLQDGGGYVEPGYKMTEVIGKTSTKGATGYAVPR